MLMLIPKILVALIAIEHLYILWLEMFQWTGKAKKVFKGYPDKFYEDTKVLAANQGLYNGFLAAGLIWSLCIQNTEWSVYVALFFLGCVAVAGIYGAATASKRILYVQAIPAIVTILVTMICLIA
jgi:putative membrane protein